MASIEKRGNSYRITVCAGYDAHGKKIRKQTTFKPSPKLNDKQKRIAAEKYAMQFENDVISGHEADAYSRKLCDFTQEYLQYKAGQFSPLTLKFYSDTIEQRINPLMGHMLLKNIRPRDCQKYILELEKPNKDGKTLATSTVRRYLTVLQSIMKTAYKLGYINENPADVDRLEIKQVEEAEIEIFSLEEIDKMLTALESEPLMYNVLINLAFDTGARRGELCGLKWSDIDLEKRVMKIERSAYKAGNQQVLTKDTKTKSSNRTVCISQEDAELLKAYKKEQNETKLKLGTAWVDGGYIFTQWNGKILYPDSAGNWFSKFQEKLNIPHRGFHAIRHTSATYNLIAGNNVKTVSKRLGHSDIRTTNRYVHSIESADRKCANTFEELRRKIG